MTAPKRRQFVSVSLTPEARDALSQAALNLTTPVGRRISISDVALAALGVAQHHEPELLAALASEPGDHES